MAARTYPGWLNPSRAVEVPLEKVYLPTTEGDDRVAHTRVVLEAYLPTRESPDFPYTRGKEVAALSALLLKGARGDDLIVGLLAAAQLRVVLSIEYQREKRGSRDPAYVFMCPRSELLKELFRKGLNRKIEPTGTLIRAALHTRDLASPSTAVIPRLNLRAVELAGDLSESNGLDEKTRAVLEEAESKMHRRERGHVPYEFSPEHLFQRAFDRALGRPAKWPLKAGEAWSDSLLARLSETDREQADAWMTLLEHAATCPQVKASKSWRKTAGKLAAPVGREVARETLSATLNMVGRPGTEPQRVYEWSDREMDATALGWQNLALLRGLVWTLASIGGSEAFDTIADTAEVCFRKLQRGPVRSADLGKACIRALLEAAADDHEALVQLARLQLKIRAPQARKTLEKAVADAAARAGLDEDELAERAVSDYGLRDGVATFEVGDVTAEIRLGDTDKPAVAWQPASGKMRRSVPPAVKAKHPEQVARVKDTAKQIESMLPAQRHRLDRLMREDRSWPMEAWRSRYADHAFVQTLARRLIWIIGDTPAAYHDGLWRNREGQEVQLEANATVHLWYPLGRDPEDVLEWRRRLEAWRITQPIKQAHREVYELTDAERATGTYSNRFAAHVLRNAIMIRLCQNLRWRTGLYGGETGPRLFLPKQNLRAEYWVDVVEEDEGDFGLPPYVATDQVRFYPHDATGLDEALPLEQVPALAFSEVMRDVDTIVGIASVGNDPNWQDSGTDGRHRDYWQDYAFGDLSATATTRRDLLQSLLPRLKIADRCTLDGKFLVVRGDLRTYKIHLGSGNILMEPNDQYLCIVPGRSADTAAGKVFLPFEGDRTLSIVLSKAFMLADDTKITDRTIVNQIKAKR